MTKIQREHIVNLFINQFGSFGSFFRSLESDFLTPIVNKTKKFCIIHEFIFTVI